MDNKSSNPVFSEKALKRFTSKEGAGVMTMRGSIGKTAYGMAIVIAAAIVGWTLVPKLGTSISWWWLLGVGIGALVVGIVAAFKSNPYTVTLYAVLEGLLIGLISRQFETAYDGIVFQAIALTLATTVGMLALFNSGFINITQKTRSIITIATVGVLLYFVFEIIISLVNPAFASILTSGPVGIVIAAVIVIIAAMNLLLDFDFITKGSEQGLAKKTEWYAAFGLLVTLIWLYISILRLLGASRR
jgi:uncharacterized YccA/Bax inhibitor family protein